MSELLAYRRVVQYARELGLNNFTTVEMSFDYGTLKEVPLRDLSAVALCVAAIKKSRKYRAAQSVVMPWHKGEVDRDAPGKRFSGILSALGVEGLQLEFPISTMTKREVIEATPKELLRLTHSCRYGAPACGRCQPCKDLKEASCKI